MEVLVVEDAPEFAQLITVVLRDAGHQVRSAGTVAAALEAASAVPPDLVVLDLTLPDGDGLDLCRVLRDRSNAYILVLTGRDDEVDKLVGFRLGADDYMTKPFSPRELAARVDALSRRPRAPLEPSNERTIGNVVVHFQARRCTVGGTTVELTRIEFDLLDTFSANPKVVFNRQQLLDRVWGQGWFGDDHVVDVHVANLRKKLAAAGADDVVRTVRGVGYGLVG